jgi:hypothetical protein
VSISRRQFLVDAALAGVATAVLPRLLVAQSQPSLLVYKDPSCGCCTKWVDHMQENGFAVSVQHTTNMGQIKARYHVADQLQSCHTAVAGGYVIEGHIPADDVKRLLKDKPKVTGLTIPGMPASAPGMDMTPYQPFTVLAFDESGKTSVFAKH